MKITLEQRVTRLERLLSKGCKFESNIYEDIKTLLNSALHNDDSWYTIDVHKDYKNRSGRILVDITDGDDSDYGINDTYGIESGYAFPEGTSVYIVTAIDGAGKVIYELGKCSTDNEAVDLIVEDIITQERSD